MIDGDIERIWGRDDLCSSEDSLFIGSYVLEGQKVLKNLRMGNIALIRKC